MTQVLYRLLAHPEYIEPLRQEVDAVISEEGWTKVGIDKMHKIDSFLHETQRLDGITLGSLRSFPSTSGVRHEFAPRVFLGSSGRVVLRPITFSNGVTVPAGTKIFIPSNAAHIDERIFTNPDVFDGFRFAKLLEGEGDKTNNRCKTVSISHEQLSFGVGRHAW